MKMLKSISNRIILDYYDLKKRRRSILAFLLVLFVATQAYGGVSDYADLNCNESDEVCIKQCRVTELYVATFNRAPDQTGLNYWVTSSFGIELIAKSFFDQPETQGLYPEGNTDAQFLTAIYHNLFNRDPDQEGFDYWTGVLGSGIPRYVMIEAVKNGATGTDRLIINNKTEVGLYYANMGLEGGDFYLFDITDNPETVFEAKETITALQADQENDVEVKISYAIVDTNQTHFYSDETEISTPSEGEAFYGQDANYDGNQASYTDNGDGTISDNVTGLMWHQDMGDKITFDEALEKAKESSLGGYGDWRVPTIKELYSLIQFDGSVMAERAVDLFIDENYFDQPLGDTSIGEREIDAQTWSATEYVGTTMNGDATVFGVNFVDGRIKGYPKYIKNTGDAKSAYFRLVRGNTEYGKNIYIDNNDGTINDLSTGLMWQTEDSKEGLDWESALEYSENLELAGHSDWRLPNAKELHSILDYTRSLQTTHSAAIDPLFDTSSINDPEGEINYPFFWSGTTHLDGPTAENGCVYIAFGEAQGEMNGVLMDVHGAGAQRSDPKSGNTDDYPQYWGPQGDVRYVYNYVRSVRTIDGIESSKAQKYK